MIVVNSAAFYFKRKLEALENFIPKILIERIIVERELVYLDYFKNTTEYESVYTEENQLIKPESTLEQLKDLVK